MEWLRDRLYNVTEIKNNKIIHSFFVERSWNQWLFLKKSFCTIRSRKKKMFSEILPQKSLRGRQYKTARTLVKAIRSLKSLKNFAYNIFIEFQLDFYQAFYNFNQTSKTCFKVCIFHIMENPYIHSSKVANCLLYVTFFN